MLTFLQIQNYTIVENLDLEFSPGFTCITGETGAGKSILVGALGLLCGDRADTSTIRSGASRAELSAGFELAEGSAAHEWLRRAELADGTVCLLRRLISGTGRSRAWINGSPVTLQQLSDLGNLLVEIHGQNEHIRLVRSDEQFRLLDGAGTHGKELDAVARKYAAWYALEKEKELLLSETPLDSGELDLLRYQIEELEQHALSPEVFRELELEHRKLARGGEIAAALEYALQTLENEQGGISSLLQQTRSELEPLTELDEDITAAFALLNEAGINCDEALRSLQSARARLDLSPDRLAELEQQLQAQHDLARKHRTDPERLMETLEQLTGRYQRAGSTEQRLQQLESDLTAALGEYRQSAAGLSACRAGRAGELSGAVSGYMQELGMEGGRFEFDVSHQPDSQPSIRGDDRLEMKVSANPGMPPGPLKKVASGGELSRISLAIKVAARSGRVAATQVFDEVDAGIGGETAHAVGALLKSLSSAGQALCVTHLAQVAVFADRQLQVLKSSGDSDTRIETSLLEENERVDEIARMLGGNLTEQSRAHAAELLSTASTRH